MEVKERVITIVGCGPGGADYLTAIACKAVAEAEILVGAQRLLDLFSGHRGRRIIVTGCINDTLDQVEKVAVDRVVAILVSGDPGIFSLGRSVLNRFRAERCRVIPGVSSVQVAFARAGVPWQDAKIISAHHKLPKIEDLHLKDVSSIAILAGHKDAGSWLVDLVDAFDKSARIVICENLTLENESVREITAAQLADTRFTARTIILLIKSKYIFDGIATPCGQVKTFFS